MTVPERAQVATMKCPLCWLVIKGKMPAATDRHDIQCPNCNVSAPWYLFEVLGLRPMESNMDDCECKEWTKVGHPFWAYRSYDDPKYHHPDCPFYECHDVDDVREQLGMYAAQVLRRSSEKTLWSDAAMLDWRDLAQTERAALCDLAVNLARVGKMLEIERGRHANPSTAFAAIAEAENRRRTMAETLTRAQQRGNELLERARLAEQQRDDALAEIARLLGAGAPPGVSEKLGYPVDGNLVTNEAGQRVEDDWVPEEDWSR